MALMMAGNTITCAHRQRAEVEEVHGYRWPGLGLSSREIQNYHH